MHSHRAFRMALAAVAYLSLAACGGCDALVPGADIGEGDTIQTKEYGYSLPANRRAYSGFASITDHRAVYILDPGSGPDDPPQAVRSYRFPDFLVWDAQIDADGYLWVATPDRAMAGGILRYVYVVDPATARVVRRIRVPQELRSVVRLLVGPERVYLRSQRNGFSGAIGVVDRRCARDADACDARLLTELGDVGLPPAHALRLIDGELFSFSNGNSQARRQATHVIDPETGQIVRSTPTAGDSGVDGESLWIQTLDYTIVRYDRATLAETGRFRHRGVNMIAVAEGKIYVGDIGEPSLAVYDAATLEQVDPIDLGAVERGPYGYVTYALGLAAPGMLLLNHTSWLDTTTGEVHAGALPFETNGMTSQLRHPQGHPLAD